MALSRAVWSVRSPRSGRTQRQSVEMRELRWPHRADFAGGPARPARPPEPTHIGSRSPYLRRIYRLVGNYRGLKSLVMDSCDEWSETRDERAHPRGER